LLWLVFIIPAARRYYAAGTGIVRYLRWRRPTLAGSIACVTTLVASDYAASELAAAGAKRITRVPAGSATAGRGFVKSEHSWDRVFDSIFDVYRRIVRVHSD